MSSCLEQPALVIPVELTPRFHYPDGIQLYLGSHCRVDTSCDPLGFGETISLENRCGGAVCISLKKGSPDDSTISFSSIVCTCCGSLIGDKVQNSACWDSNQSLTNTLSNWIAVGFLEQHLNGTCPQPSFNLKLHTPMIRVSDKSRGEWPALHGTIHLSCFDTLLVQDGLPIVLALVPTDDCLRAAFYAALDIAARQTNILMEAAIASKKACGYKA